MTKQKYGCQCLRFLMCAQMLMHAIAHGGFTNTVRESALKADSGRKYSSVFIKCCQSTQPTLHYIALPHSLACRNTCACACMHVHTHTCTHAHTHTHTCIHACMCMYACMHAYTHTHTLSLSLSHTYTHTHPHTHTHTHSLFSLPVTPPPPSRP